MKIFIKTIKCILSNKFGWLKLLGISLFNIFLNITIADFLVLEKLIEGKYYTESMITIFTVSLITLILFNKLLYYNNFSYRYRIDNYDK